MIQLDAGLPEIIFYENNPLLGILNNKALTNYNLNAEELNIIAYPFFFSVEDTDNLQFDWELDGKKLTHLSNEIIFKQSDEGKEGASNIFLEIQNLKKIMQFGSGDFVINSARINDAIQYYDF